MPSLKEAREARSCETATFDLRQEARRGRNRRRAVITAATRKRPPPFWAPIPHHLRTPTLSSFTSTSPNSSGVGGFSGGGVRLEAPQAADESVRLWGVPLLFPIHGRTFKVGSQWAFVFAWFRR